MFGAQLWIKTVSTSKRKLKLESERAEQITQIFCRNCYILYFCMMAEN